MAVPAFLFIPTFRAILVNYVVKGSHLLIRPV